MTTAVQKMTVNDVRSFLREIRNGPRPLKGKAVTIIEERFNTDRLDLLRKKVFPELQDQPAIVAMIYSYDSGPGGGGDQSVLIRILISIDGRQWIAYQYCRERAINALGAEQVREMNFYQAINFFSHAKRDPSGAWDYGIDSHFIQEQEQLVREQLTS